MTNSGEKVPLRLLVDPDEYLCDWFLPVDGVISRFSGSLRLGVNESPEGVVYGELPKEELAPGLTTYPQKLTFPHLRGRLLSGYEVSLVNATIQIGWLGGDQGIVTADSATVGIPWTNADDSEPPAPRYPGCVIQVGGLDALSGTAPFTKWKLPDWSAGIGQKWTVKGNPNLSQEWQDDSATVRLGYRATMSTGDPFAVRFLVSPVLRIEVQEPLTVAEWVGQWALPMRKIASIVLGRAQDLTFLGMEDSSSGPEKPRQVYGTGVSQSPYTSSRQNVQKLASPLKLAVDGVSLLAMLRRWQQLEADHHPLVETYGSMLAAPNEHPRSRFLLLIQALEGTHGYDTGLAYELKTQKHLETRNDLLAAVTGLLTADQLKFIKTNLVKRPHRGLAEALKSSIGSLPQDLTPELLSCELVSTIAAPLPGKDLHRAGQALSTIRNDLAHGNRGFSIRQIAQIVVVLEKIVRGHALHLMDCPEAVIQRVCDAQSG